MTWAALIAAAFCFIIYVASAIATLLAKPAKAATDMPTTAKSIPTAVSAEDYAKLLEAAAKLTDSLSKAGPTLVSLIGALLFLLIAAVSSGALRAAPPPCGTIPPVQCPKTPVDHSTPAP